MHLVGHGDLGRERTGRTGRHQKPLDDLDCVGDPRRTGRRAPRGSGQDGSRRWAAQQHSILTRGVIPHGPPTLHPHRVQRATVTPGVSIWDIPPQGVSDTNDLLRSGHMRHRTHRLGLPAASTTRTTSATSRSRSRGPKLPARRASWSSPSASNPLPGLPCSLAPRAGHEYPSTSKGI
ncbi:RNA polymerase sigma factor [Carbonactinospora thermoautotrophica]|uniref:RNA polymerase sigma factor n=1 Tax=Carbonactinospora thermoautotrophica TaxID=1469144 RepID=A0A132MPL4_9ACTN|nr:RNA polymerase sigma factor [Carbonactinospora thermoautotrophica]